MKDDASNTVLGWLNTGTTTHSFTDVADLSLESYKTYNISVSAVNKAGLRSAPVSRLFYVETTPPTVTSMWFILQKVHNINGVLIQYKYLNTIYFIARPNYM